MSEYQAWEAKFLRLASTFGLFGLAMIGVGAQFRRLRRVDQVT